MAIWNFLGDRLLPADAAERLRAFHYRGSNVSLLYEHLSGPLADWLVAHVVPSWLA